MQAAECTEGHNNGRLIVHSAAVATDFHALEMFLAAICYLYTNCIGAHMWHQQTCGVLSLLQLWLATSMLCLCVLTDTMSG